MKSILLSVPLYLAAAATALPFGHDGHRTVALIAKSNLTPKADTAIAAILQGESLDDAAMWPDEIKWPRGKLSNTAEAQSFRGKHADNNKWHYVNFPVGATKYSPTSQFAYAHDIVHIINGCISVLEGGSFERLSKKEALRWLCHLVGDIHQPLHTVAGYYDLTDLNSPKFQTNPDLMLKEVGDAGGNALDYGASNMHSMWDSVLIFDFANSGDVPAVVVAAKLNAKPASSYAATGKHGTWAAKWATDSMKIAAKAYADIEIVGPATLNDEGQLEKVAVRLKPSTQEYRAKNKAMAKEQVYKAGVRLGQLLNAIDWDEDN